MARWRNTGGQNKTHRTVEKVSRIDSFEVAEIQGWGTVWAGQHILDCYTDLEYGECSIFIPGMADPLEITTDAKPNGFGGAQTFFLCPRCGQRGRYLYFKGRRFVCRKCAKLNYRSQQETRTGTMYFHNKGEKYAEKHLNVRRGDFPDGFHFSGWVPPRPRYMHRDTYKKHLLHLIKYQQQHLDRETEGLARLLRLFK